MSEQYISYELDGDIALVGIDRAEKRNAISQKVMTQLHDAFARAADEARCGVLFGHGDNFSAGLDLAEAAARFKSGAPSTHRTRGQWTLPLDQIARGGLPWIAALRGACIGGGLEIASACHIRVADETTYFALPEGKRGIFVGGGGSVRIQRLIGYARMADMMLTGRSLSAAEGEGANLCQYVVPAGQSLDNAKELARTVAANAASTNWGICSALPRINDMGHDDGLFFEGLISLAARSTDGAARVGAFLGGQDKVAAPDQKD